MNQAPLIHRAERIELHAGSNLGWPPHTATAPFQDR